MSVREDGEPGVGSGCACGSGGSHWAGHPPGHTLLALETPQEGQVPDMSNVC